MLSDSKPSKRDLFKTDVNTVYINLNERFNVPNKYGKKNTDPNADMGDGINQKIKDYQNRFMYPLSNTKYQKVTYKYYDPAIVETLLSQETSCERLLDTFTAFEGTKFAKTKKRIHYTNLPMIEFYKHYSLGKTKSGIK